jgi:hypothetical protein
MNQMGRLTRRGSAPLLIVAIALLVHHGSGEQIGEAGPQYTKGGAMKFPTGYREWTFLTSGLGMTYGFGTADAAGNPNFDNVFADRAAYSSFLKTGTWPDKTVLILEVRGSDSHVSINKGGHVQTKVVGVEAHVKDAARGGWAFYAFEPGAAEGNLIPKTRNCYSCHEQNGAVDTTFVQFYPELSETARQHGTLKADR